MNRPMDAHFAREALRVVRALAEVSQMEPVDARDLVVCELERESVMLMNAWRIAVDRGAATPLDVRPRIADA